MAAAPSNGSEIPKAKHTAALSTKILNMRFMQKAYERDLQQQLEEQQKRIQDESQWVLPSRDKMMAYAKGVNFHDAKRRRVVEVETSYVPFSLVKISGRRSFQNFSKNLEQEANKADIPPDVQIPAMHHPNQRYMRAKGDVKAMRPNPNIDPQLTNDTPEDKTGTKRQQEHDSDEEIIHGARTTSKRRRPELADSESTAETDGKKKRKKKATVTNNFIKPE